MSTNLKAYNNDLDWDMLCLPGQREILIDTASSIMNDILSNKNISLLTKDLSVTKKFSHERLVGMKYLYEEVNDTIKLTKNGFVENYYEHKFVRDKIFWIIPNNYTAAIPHERILSNHDFPAVIEKYKLSPKKLLELESILNI